MNVSRFRRRRSDVAGLTWLAVIILGQVGLSAGQSCDHFVDIEGGEVTYDHPNDLFLPSGSKAVLHCFSNGHQVVSTCVEGVWSPPSLGSCDGNPLGFKRMPQRPPVLSTCPPMHVPPNSAISYSSMSPPYPHGTLASLVCALGYAPVGRAAAECDDGEWSSLGSCERVSDQRCAQIMGVPHGIINYVPGGNGAYDYGSVAELTCAFGYELVGNGQLVCQSAGWTPYAGLGRCQAQYTFLWISIPRFKRQMGTPQTTPSIGECGPLTIVNGQVSYIQSNPLSLYAAGSSAILSCNLGFMVSGTAWATCQNGVWSPALGTCSSTQVGGMGLGTVPTGTLGGLGGAGQCGAMLTLVFNGQIAYSQGGVFGPFPAGSTATLQCNLGFVPDGTATSSCTNGVWNPPTLGSCVGTTGASNAYGVPTSSSVGNCLTLGTVLNGDITYSAAAQGMGTYTANTVATLVCTSGTITGSSQTTCRSGAWSPPLGTCSATGITSAMNMQCVFGVPSLLAGTVEYSDSRTIGPWPAGTTATLLCSGGTPMGPSTATCSNGVWNPPSFPGCQSSGGGGMLGLPTMPGATTCLMGMPLVFNGQVSYSSIVSPYPTGTTATLTCNSGFKSEGQTTSTCQNGIWTPSTFAGCTTTGSQVTSPAGMECAGGLVAPLNGQILYSTGTTFGPFPSGATATLQCNNGYSISGAPFATCTNGQFTPATLGTCTYGLSSALGTTPGVIGGIVSPTTAETIREDVSPSLNSTTTENDPQCDPNEPKFPVLPNGRLVLLESDEESSALTANVTCFDGYEPSASTVSVECRGLGYRPLTVVHCVPKSLTSRATVLSTVHEVAAGCRPSNFAVQRGRVVLPGGANVTIYHAGAVATLICDPGTVPNGGLIWSVCADNGTWMPPKMGCHDIDGMAPTTSPAPGLECNPIPKVDGGAIAYSEYYRGNGPYGDRSTATLVCDLGRLLDGAALVSCHNGTWQPAMGHCKPVEGTGTASTSSAAGGSFAAPMRPMAALIRCPPLRTTSLISTLEFDEPPLADGLYPNGTTVRLICLDDQAVIHGGASLSVCTAGMWQPVIGECEVDDSAPPATVTSSRPGIGSCQPLETPLRGRISYIQSGAEGGYEIGTTAILNCDIGYAVSGNAVLSCISSDLWAPAAGFGHCVANEDLVKRAR